MESFDFSGWATRNDIRCSDGRTIRTGAFKHNSGKTVPLVWNHSHNEPTNVLGHALLENRDEGVYAYCKFNDTMSGQNAKELVKNKDVTSLSIYANKLQQTKTGDVLHGEIRELSLVLSGANPGAYIDNIMMHGEESDEEAIIFNGEEISYDSGDLNIEHSSIEDEDELSHADEKAEEKPKEKENNMANENQEKTVKDVFDTLNEEQKTVVYALIGQALEDAGASGDEEGDEDMKHNVFDQDEMYEGDYLSHADEEAIISMAKSTSVGSLREAMELFAEQNSLQHGALDDMSALFPEYQLIDPAEPEIVYDDDTWVAGVINGVHKSPFTRVKTRKADARKAELTSKLQAIGYPKGTQKKLMSKIKLLGRTHDAQTIYIKDKLDRDDILDITEFDAVAYQWKIMRHTLNQTIAECILFGDGRTDIDPDKIKEDKIRPVWHDNELYCMHHDIDIAGMKTELQGTNTGANFGDNFIFAEALITKSLYAREKYKGSGNLTLYIAPHAVNRMLLARDLNGRRIYKDIAELKAALNVKEIVTVEQMDTLNPRVTSDNKQKKLLALYVNLSDYQLGCVKGGEITQFNQFDIDFNQEKLLLETRLSGALVEWYSAIALEEDVTPASSSSSAGSDD